jgi:hypothetical protein
MEGLAVRAGSEPHEVFVYLMSDNNFNTRLQHTYLMMFRLLLEPEEEVPSVTAPAEGVLTLPHSPTEAE